MTSKPPRVSVVIATFNRAILLQRALLSVMEQDLSDLEVVIVDDGSTDTTLDVVNSFAAMDSRLKYVFQANQGLATARNTGITTSSGDYVTFLDSDDEYKSSHLRLRVELLDLREDIQMLHGGLEVVNGDWMVPDYYHPGRVVDLRKCAVGATFFIRRSAFETVGLFVHRDFGEDTEFFARAERSLNVVRVEWPTYRYFRDSPDSIVSSEVRRLADRLGTEAGLLP